MASRTMTVKQFFDGNRFTPYQAWVSVLCFSVVLFDGFDLTAIGVTLPKIAEFLHAEPSALGLAVGAGQVGPLVGAILFGMLADRSGRKLMLFFSALIFGTFTFMTAYISTVEQLAACRLLAGIGLGGAIPNALAYGCEYAPTRMRASLTTGMWAGMAFGSVLGGLSASFLIPHYGWQSLFVVGGIAPVVIGLLVALLLPESLEFLVRQGKDIAQIDRIVSRIAPNQVSDKGFRLAATQSSLPGVAVKNLFTDGRAWTTLLLWILFFMSFYLIWILLSWAPTLLRKSGASVQQYSLAFACINFGSALAIIAVGRLMDRFDPFRTLKIANILAAMSLVLFGWFAGSSFAVISIVCVITGIFVFGSNSGVVALCTVSYPLDIRATGIGWAYAIGKVGSLLAPVVGGFLLSRQWSVAQICAVNATVGVLIALVIVILQIHLASVALRDEAPETSEGRVAVPRTMP